MAKKKHAEHVNHERWLVSYADFITLLFAFFVVMFAVSKTDSDKVGRFSESFQDAIGIQLGDGRGMLTGERKIDVVPKPPYRSSGKPSSLEQLERTIAEEAQRKRELAGMKVVRRGNELVLRLDAAILFGSGEDSLSADAEPVLAAVADLVRGKSVRMRVEGHTDDRPISSGRYRSNWDLSSARASSVVVSLAERHGFDPARLSSGGYAHYQPIAENTTDAGRAQNRRVDFVVSLDADATASLPAEPKPNDEKTGEGKASDARPSDAKPTEAKD